MILAAMTVGEALAGPTHAHKHRHLQKKDYDVDWSTLDWNDMGIDWSSAWAAGQHTSTTAAAVVPTTTSAAPVVAPAATTAAAPAASHTAAGAAADSEGAVLNEVATLFNNLVGIANSFTSFGASTTASGSDVGSIGNIGLPQGSNMIKVSSTEGQAFTATFINTSGGDITIAIWNKAYSTTGNVADAQANLGSCVAPTTPILTFALAPTQRQIVAFLADSQIGFSQVTDRIAESGAFAISWGEVNFMTSGSGYDLSAIMNSEGNNYNMTISSLESSCISNQYQNFWLTASDPVGSSDGSCYIAQSTATLTVEMAGEGTVV
jgi:hypothetical protein